MNRQAIYFLSAFGSAANNGGIDDRTAEKLLQEEVIYFTLFF